MLNDRRTPATIAGMARVADHMRPHPLVLPPEIELAEAVRRLEEAAVDAAVVLEGNRLVGLVSRSLLTRGLADTAGDSEVREWMVHFPETLEPDAPLDHAALLLLHGGLAHLPVTANGDVVGLLALGDVERVVPLDDRAPRGA